MLDYGNNSGKFYMGYSSKYSKLYTGIETYPLPLLYGYMIDFTTNNNLILYRVIYESKLRCNMSVFINKVISLFSSVYVRFCT